MKHKVKHLHFIACDARNRKTIAGGDRNRKPIAGGDRNRKTIAGGDRNRKPIAWSGSALVPRAATNAETPRGWR